MKLIIQVDDDKSFQLDVPQHMPWDDLRALIMAEAEQDTANVELWVADGQRIDSASQLHDGLAIVIRRIPAAGAIVTEEESVLRGMYDVNEQRRLMQLWQQQRIDANLREALEHHANLFGSVSMLHIRCSLNGHALKAFVDCGAQTTVISLRLVQRCHLDSLVDNRWQGMARGVGERRIVGRIHAVPLIVHDHTNCQDAKRGLHLPCSLTVLEDDKAQSTNDSDADFLLLGLDMLRMHQAVIDLHGNVLRIHGVAIPFLTEGEINQGS